MIRISYIKNNSRFYLTEEFFGLRTVVKVAYDYDIDKMFAPLNFYKNIFFTGVSNHTIPISRNIYIERFDIYD